MRSGVSRQAIERILVRDDVLDTSFRRRIDQLGLHVGALEVEGEHGKFVACQGRLKEGFIVVGALLDGDLGRGWESGGGVGARDDGDGDVWVIARRCFRVEPPELPLAWVWSVWRIQEHIGGRTHANDDDILEERHDACEIRIRCCDDTRAQSASNNVHLYSLR